MNLNMGRRHDVFAYASRAPQLAGLVIAMTGRTRYVLMVVCTALAVCMAGAADIERMRLSIVRMFGDNAESRYQDWKQMIESAKALGTSQKLARINEFFNRRLRFGEDQEIWGQGDYWATPMESLGKGAGDCEDFAIAKYFSLLLAGVANEQLRLIYVRARIGDPSSGVSQAHMVLAYYPAPDAEPMVLDNLITSIRPAAQRPDLFPVFSFNSQGIFQAGSKAAAPAANVSRLSRWKDLLQRARNEGFDTGESHVND